MIDYLVVGLGLAGVSFCDSLEKNGKTFMVISDESQISSKVAGGLYNPVVLKRFNLAWNAKLQLEEARPFYAGLEKKLSLKLDYPIPVLRRFYSIEEQNLWFEAADKPSLSTFLSTPVLSNHNPQLDAPFGYGEVRGSGRIDTRTLLLGYGKYLMNKKLLKCDPFIFKNVQMESDGVSYEGIRARNIVFATGFGLNQNPFFNYLPLQGNKGELLTIHAPDLKEVYVIKSSVFLIPLGDDLYRVGATYNRADTTNIPTDQAKEQLLKKLNSFVKSKYEVVEHVAGIRPTVADRRPLVGKHPAHPQLWVLNGFGSRGVLIAPYAAKRLYDCIEHQKPLPPEMDIARFKKRYLKSLDGS